MERIQAKSILSKLKDGPDNWFGTTYNINLYRGCQHQCIYCDSRSECYQIADFTKIQIKANAIELLGFALKRLKKKGTIGTGSMNDPYMPVEEQELMTRRALQVIAKYNFPVHILTKSNLVVRDIDLLQNISKTYAAVSTTITTASDDLCRIIEPAASLTSERFAAIKQLSAAGIYCGILLMPVLPFITDSLENIEQIVRRAKEAGAKYILASMGMTLRDKQRDYYYKELDKNFPGLRQKYLLEFGNRYGVATLNYNELQQHFNTLCAKHNLPIQLTFYNQDKPGQLRLF